MAHAFGPEQVPKLLKAAESQNGEMRISLLRTAVALDPLDTLGHHQEIILKRGKINISLISCVREKTRISKGDSMDEYWHPFGNTPAINLLKHHQDQPVASVLSVASGDLRHVLYTCSQLKAATKQFQEVEFFLNDSDPRVVARNVLFALLLDGATFQHSSKDSIELVIALWYSARISQEHASMLRAALDTLLERMVVGAPWSCGNVKLDAESTSLVCETLQYWRQLPPGTEPQWLEKSKTSCMKVDCCRLLGRWNSCTQQYFRTKTLQKCEAKIRNLTWNPTMCHPEKAVHPGSLPFRGYFLQDLTQESRHLPDKGHQVCLGQKMLGMLRSMLGEARANS